MKIDGWYRLRAKRDTLLAQTDKFMLADFPIDTKMRAAYREYRQYLRDCPKMYNDEAVKTAIVKTFEEWKAWRNGGAY